MDRNRVALIHEDLTHSVIGAFYDAHRKLGFGYLEPLCARALEKELVKRGHRVRREISVPVFYDGEQIGWHRLDMVVDATVVVEIKSTESLPAIARRQLRAYLRSTRLEVGLLLHFGHKANFCREVHTNEPERAIGSRSRQSGAADLREETTGTAADASERR